MSTARHDDSLGIDDILARIRAELATDEPARPAVGERAARRASAVRVPLLTEDGSALPAKDSYTIEEFERLDEETFLQAAYRALLDRDVDGSGRTHYLPALRDGRSTVVGILGALRWSAEGRARGIHVKGLKFAYFLDRASRTPYVGRLIGPVLRTAKLSRTIRRLHRRIAATDLRHRETVQALNGSLMSVRRSLTQLEAEAYRLEMETVRIEGEAVKAHTVAQAGIDGSDGARIELATARKSIASEARRLAEFADRARNSLPPVTDSLSEGGDGDAILDSLYVAFENRFRGSTVEIGRRQARYLDIFRGTPPVAAGKPVLDIGCGRGEWLQLLGQANVVARGIDLNGAMVEFARAQGLDATEGDAIAHLRSLPEGTLGGVTGFHIVEHLAFRDLVAMLDEAYRALAPGGVMLFETPNPENLVVGACTFNYDPTHNRALPPDFLRFLAETRGFDAVRVIRSDGDCNLDQPESGFAPTEINDWFRQPPDYAVYARKPDAGEGGA